MFLALTKNVILPRLLIAGALYCSLLLIVIVFNHSTYSIELFIDCLVQLSKWNNMKLLLSITALVVIFTSVAQTDIIATRSHGGNVSKANSLAKGNFGLDEPSFEILKVEYIGNNCVVEKRKWYGDNSIYLDTSCHNQLFEGLDYNVNKIKEYFPKSVKFAGFDKYTKEQKQKRRNDASSIPWFLALISLSYFSYLFFPTIIRKRNPHD
ncbi:MAG: hypothetical protein ACI865_000139 [Flavobacteriaceae bacterium]